MGRAGGKLESRAELTVGILFEVFVEGNPNNDCADGHKA